MLQYFARAHVALCRVSIKFYIKFYLNSAQLQLIHLTASNNTTCKLQFFFHFLFLQSFFFPVSICYEDFSILPFQFFPSVASLFSPFLPHTSIKRPYANTFRVSGKNASRARLMARFRACRFQRIRHARGTGENGNLESLTW